MRIVIDLQGLQSVSRHRGIGRYSLSLTKALLRNRGQHEIIVLLSGLFPDTIETIRSVLVEECPSIEIKIWDGVGPVAFLDQENDWRRSTSQLIREAFIASLEPDVLLISSMFEGVGDDTVTSIGQFEQIPTAVILYDLIPLIYREDYLADQQFMNWYQEKLRYIKKADVWLAISESSRQEGIHHLGLPEGRVVNISAAVEPVFHKHEYSRHETASLYGKFGLTRPFLMYSGASDPRKNIYKLIEAYAATPTTIRESHQLVLAGGMPEYHKVALLNHAKSVGLAPDEVVITGRLTDDELVALYSLCKAFILPSLHEGFGLPALEAMACGAPAIGSNLSSIPEVIGLDAALFDPRSVEQISKKIVAVLSNDELRATLIENARARTTLFSWDRSANTALRKLESLAQDATYQKARIPFDSSRAISRLITKIASLKSTSVTESDLLYCSSAIAAILPRDDPTPRIFVDVSELHRRYQQSGLQQLDLSLARTLLESPVNSHRIQLVYASEAMLYRHAANLSCSLLGREIATDSLADEAIEPQTGDIFLGLDCQDQNARNHADYYEYLRQRGLHVSCVVYEQLPNALTKYLSEEDRLNYEKWLSVFWHT